MTPGHKSTLNCDPRLRFHVELWPRVMVPRWIVTSDLDSTLNCDPKLNCDLGLGSQFNVEFLPWGQNSTWNFDPGFQFNVEFWPIYISSTRGIATQAGVKIQQRDQVSTAKEGHNSTKNPLNIDPGSVFNWGVKILSYTCQQVRVMPIWSHHFIRKLLKMSFCVGVTFLCHLYLAYY